MPNSEKSFRDRQGRFQQLRDATAGFSPAFDPPDASLNPTNLQATLTGEGGIEEANSTVERLTGSYTTAAAKRVALVKTVQKAATQAIGYVKSNSAWAVPLRAVKAAVDQLRGVTPPKKIAPPAESPEPPPEPPPAPGKKRRRTGLQSYKELAAHLQRLIDALSACPGYAPSEEITVERFNEHLASLKAHNGGITTLAKAIAEARKKRLGLYTGTGGLEEKFQAVKNAVKGQYGQDSDQYRTVKRMKW